MLGGTEPAQASSARIVVGTSREFDYAVDIKVFLAISGLLVGLIFGWITRPTIPIVGLQFPFKEFMSSLISGGGIPHDIAFQTLIHVGLFVVATMLVAVTTGFILARAGYDSIDVSPAYAFYRRFVRNPQDFWGGLVLLAFSVFAIWAADDLSGMRGFAFGPGTAPRLFAMLLGVAGAVVALLGVFLDGPRVEAYRIRGPLFVVASTLFFAATVRPFGLVIASFISILICAAAAEDVRWRESLLWAVILTVFCSLLFPYALGLPLQLWPRF
jgi:putative tricarboxylic transport membrane protein